MLYFFTGAGLSAESGIPTFRDSGGYWDKFDPTVMADIDSFEKNYELVHQFYNSRRKALSSVKPNFAHESIARLQSQLPTHIMTTNVDDLLERAGCVQVQHIHGNILEVVQGYGTGDATTKYIGYEDVDTLKHPLHSDAACKPGVIFFGEHAPEYQQMFNTFCDMKEDDLLIVIGCSDVVLQPMDMGLQSKLKHIFLVNNDFEACLKYKENERVSIFTTTATQFFKDIPFFLKGAFKNKEAYEMACKYLGCL